MNELVSLFPVLFVVYALQCFATAPPGAVVFILDSQLRGRLLRYSWPLGRSQYRLFFLNPFLPLRSALYSTRYPLSFLTDPSGRVDRVKLTGSDFANSSSAVISFEPPHRFTSNLKQLLADDTPVATFPSERMATHFANFLVKLQGAPLTKRATRVGSELRRMFALEVLRERLQLLSRCTVFLNALRFSLFLFVFLLAPAGIYAVGLRRIWPGLLVGLGVYLVLILWAFRRAHRRLYPQGNDGYLQHFLTIAFSPFAAIRAADSLIANLLEDFHPIAIARALLSDEDFQGFAERELRRTKFITQDPILESSFMAFLAGEELDPHSMLAPPARNDERSRSYCPACLTQYVIEEGSCEDCEDTSLQPFPPGKP